MSAWLKALLCMLVCLPKLAGADMLRLSADAVHVEYGKPVWLAIESNITDASLTQLDFSPWQDMVFVVHERDVAHDPQTGLQRWRVRLYPRNEGRLELPPLLFAGMRSNSLVMKVETPQDPKTGMPIQIDCQTPIRSPYQQQQVLVRCDLGMQDPHVLFEYPRQTLRDAQLHPMQVTREADGTQTRHQVGWVVQPQRSGEYTYDLPPLQLLRDGVITHQFYLPRLRLVVRPLPIYLPGTIPVGTLGVSRYALRDRLLAPDHLSELELHIEVKGVLSEGLPDYALRVPSDRRLQTYAARREYVQRIDARGIGQSLRYTIPVTAMRQGLYALPALRLEYFDPDSGRLQTRVIAGEYFLVLAWWSRLVLLILAAALLFVLGRYGYRVLKRIRLRRRYYRHALAGLGGPLDIAQIRQIMQQMAQAEGLPANLSYSQWQRRMSGKVRDAAELPCQQLYEASYAGITHDLHMVRDILIQLCRQRLRVLPARSR